MDIDAPDYELFPDLFNADTVEFRAGAELPILNAAASLLARLRLNLAPLTVVFTKTLGAFGGLGTDAGAIGVQVSGEETGRSLVTRNISIVANTQAPRIAILPAVVAIAKISSGGLPAGLMSHRTWVSESELSSWCSRFGFRLIQEQSHD